MGWVRQYQHGAGWSGIWAHSDELLIAVGANGDAARWNGDAWVPEITGTTESLFDVMGDSPDDIFAVGEHGTLLHFAGSGWASIDTPINTRLRAVWHSGELTVVVGEAGWVGMLRPST